MSLASCKKGQYGGNTSLVHVRKFCILKPPLGQDSATEDISATFSMLVNM